MVGLCLAGTALRRATTRSGHIRARAGNNAAVSTEAAEQGEAAAGLSTGGNLLAMAGSVGVPTAASSTAVSSAPIALEAWTAGRQSAQTHTAKAEAAVAAVSKTTAAVAANIPADEVVTAAAARAAVVVAADMDVGTKAQVLRS